VARTTQRRQEAATPRQGRFGRGSTGQTQSPRRRRRQPEQSGAQKLMQGIRGMLPGGGKSSTGQRSGGSIPVVGGLLSSLGGSKKRGAGRGRKPAVFGLLGAGAAGAAAAVAKRRHGSRSSETVVETPAHPADAPPPGDTAKGPDTPPDPDTPTAT
jgi:hypothetical protein